MKNLLLILIAALFIGQAALASCDSQEAKGNDYDYGGNDCSWMWMMMNSGAEMMGEGTVVAVCLGCLLVAPQVMK